MCEHVCLKDQPMQRGGIPYQRSMMTGGALTSTAPSTAPSSGAKLDSRLLSGFAATSYAHNSCVAKEEWTELTAVSNAATGAVVQWSLPASTARGQMLDLSASYIQLDYAAGTAGTTSFWQKYLTSSHFFDRISVTYGGVACNNQTQGLEHLNSATMVALTEPYSPLSSWWANYNENDLGTKQFESGIISPPATRSRALNNTAMFNGYRQQVQTNQAGAGSFRARVYNPLFSESQKTLLPCTLPLEVEVSKWGGAAFPFAVLQTGPTGGVQPPQYVPGVVTPRLFVRRVTLSSLGESLFASLLAETKLLHVPVTRNIATRFNIAAGSSAANFLVVQKRPRTMCVWFNDVSTQTLTPGTGGVVRLRHNVSPLCAFVPDGGTALPPVSIQSLRVVAGGDVFPKYPSGQAISRTNTGQTMHGGTSSLDSIEYQKLCAQYADGITTEVQPFLSRTFMDGGQGWQCFFVNLAEDGEPIFGRQNPAPEAGNISIEMVFNKATVVATQCTVISLYQEEIHVNPVLGSVRCSWA